MTDRDYLSTGEAAQLLNISRSTVARRFDQGLLRGKAHRITGERLIARDSIASFMKQHAIPVDPAPSLIKRIVLRTGAPDLTTAVEALEAKGGRFQLDVAERGSEALILCSRKPANLLILDDSETDIACKDMISSLRRQEDQDKLAILCCLRDTDPQEVASWGANSVLAMRDLSQEALDARILQLLGLTKDQGRDTAPFEHSRRWPRYPVNLPCKVGVYRTDKPHEYSWGGAMVDNISLGGAGLSHMTFDAKSIPTESFRMRLQIDQSPLPDWSAFCQVIRMSVNGQLTAGLQFVHITKSCREKISALEQAYC